MRKIIFIIIVNICFFLLEYIIHNVFSSNFNPNLLLLALIFFNLYYGIRYSIFSAFIAGLILDSFSTNTFGINMFSFVFCAYMTTALKKYIYHMGSRLWRLFLILIILIINIFTHYVLNIVVGAGDFVNTIRFILVPEVVITLLISIYIFNFLEKCALKYYV